MSPEQLRLLARDIEEGWVLHPLDYITEEEERAIILALRFHAELLEITRP
jgi:hypothetical protein